MESDKVTELKEQPVPVSCHGPFFRDSTFANSWDLIARNQRVYEDAAHLEHNKFSVEKDLAFRSMVLNAPVDENGAVPVVIGKDDYQVILDMQHFRPEEVKVSLIRGCMEEENYLVVEGKHEEKNDPGAHHNTYISRHFSRTYQLPSPTLSDLDKLNCNISADGILQVVIPRRPVEEPKELEQQNGGDEGIMHKLKDKLIYLLPDFHLRPIWNRVVHAVHLDKPQMGVQSDREYFRVLVDVKGFNEDELSVECNNYTLTVSGEHGKKRDEYGSIARKFRSTYELPRSVQSTDELECKLLGGGILEIKAPKQQIPEDAVAKQIAIVLTDEAQEERKEMQQRMRDEDADIGASWLYWSGIPPC